MLNYFPLDWKRALENSFDSNYFSELDKKVSNAYSQTSCYPELTKIFSAFEHCTPDEVKVVIIGQDPYHQKGQANGLAFSVAKEVANPPSLQNIIKEVRSQYGDCKVESGDLTGWAKQGVLLLNASLSVEDSKPNSHRNLGWAGFTDRVIDYLSSTKKDLVFLLWGSFAHKKGRNINDQKHLVLKTGHPSPLSANRGFWFNNEHFKLTNAYLKDRGKGSIVW